MRRIQNSERNKTNAVDENESIKNRKQKTENGKRKTRPTMQRYERY